MKYGVFTPELMCDMLAYGLWTACLCMGSFVIVMFGFGDGKFGTNCNRDYSPGCDTAFRARATCFASLTWQSLFLAWEMVNMRRSFFRMVPGSKRYFTQWMVDVWRNKVLFSAVIFGFITVFPLNYIPVLNEVVFKHTTISWEWAVVFIAALLFFAGIELWKWIKRAWFRRQDRKKTGGTKDIEARVFGVYYQLGGVDMNKAPSSPSSGGEKEVGEKSTTEGNRNKDLEAQ